MPGDELAYDAQGNIVLTFKGMNNIADPARLPLGFCPDICDMDVGDDYSLSPAGGYTDLGIPGVTSGWSDNSKAFCIYDEVICSFDGVDVTPLLGTPEVPNPVQGQPPLVAAGPVPTMLPVTEFCPINDVVYFSDGVTCGVIADNIIYVNPVQTIPTTENDIVAHVATTYPAKFSDDASNIEVDAYQFSTPAGVCLEFYNGVLYYAIGPFVFATMALDVRHIDLRTYRIAGYPDNVTMIKRTVDGLYVGTTKGQYFLDGAGVVVEGSKVVSGFKQRQIADRGAIYGTGVHVQGEFVKAVGVKNTLVPVWASPLGIFAGGPGGATVNLSANTVAFPDGAAGAAMFITQGGQYKYIVCYTAVASAFANRYSADFEINPVTATAQAWTVNTMLPTTEGHSYYSDFPLTSMFCLNDIYYGTTAANGVVALGGTPSSEPYVTTARLGFGRSRINLVPDVYLGARCDGALSVDLIVDETQVATALPVVFDVKPGIHYRKVKLPRGVRGAYWQFRIRGGSSTKLTLAEIAINPLTSPRTSR